MALDEIPIDIDAVSVVVAGPIVRRTSRTSVSVWLALTQPDGVVLTVTDPSTGASTTGTSVPTRVGTRLWMTVVTAAAPGGAFLPGALYLYDLSAATGAARPIELTDGTLPDLALPGLALPSFLGPPDDVTDLGLLHASCRKPHGGGHDGLALADAALSLRATGGSPAHLLLLSGDQIYADEVGHPLAVRVNRVAADLVGINESDVFGPTPRIGDRKAETNGFGFTTGSGSNHLWTYGEFMAMYLLAWSPVLWPDDLEPFPADDAVREAELADGLGAESWNRQLGHVRRFPGGPSRGGPSPGERAVADDPRRPRGHRRLEPRPGLGRHRLRRSEGPAGRGQRPPGLCPVPALGQCSGPLRHPRLSRGGVARRGGLGRSRADQSRSGGVSADRHAARRNL